jgi:Rrf2 family protein
VFSISRRVDYGLRLLLALGGSHHPMSKSSNLSKQIGVPLPFLYKITTDLVQSGLVKTLRGAKGGLRLAVNPAEISMLDVVRALDEEICLSPCLDRPNQCPRNAVCGGHVFWDQLQSKLAEELSSTSLANLLDLEGGLRSPTRFKKIEYSIRSEASTPVP